MDIAEKYKYPVFDTNRLDDFDREFLRACTKNGMFVVAIQCDSITSKLSVCAGSISENIQTNSYYPIVIKFSIEDDQWYLIKAINGSK